jgi:hypothetical protein
MRKLGPNATVHATDQILISEHQLPRAANTRWLVNPPIVGAVVASDLGRVKGTRGNSDDILYGLRAGVLVRLGVAAVGRDGMARSSVPK